MSVRMLTGDCREVMRELPDASVQMVCTSPPYFGLRDYGTASWQGGDAACDHSGIRRGHGDEKQATSAGTSRDPVSRECRKCGATRVDQQIGLENTVEDYVAQLVAVFREVRRCLRDDGVLFLNLGDSYATKPKNNAYHNRNGTPESSALAGGGAARQHLVRTHSKYDVIPNGLKPKDLIGIPWRVAFALQADGWYLRSDIIWAKPNPMPESVRDRPTKAHEYIFLLTKSPRYFWDAEAVKEANSEASGGWKSYQPRGLLTHGSGETSQTDSRAGFGGDPSGRNIRSVWTIATAPFAEAHFATFPPALAERCIKAGSAAGDVVLDPFGGAGTVSLVAERLGRDSIYIDLSSDYAAMAKQRITGDAPMFAMIT